jgi:peroxiredoxin
MKTNLFFLFTVYLISFTLIHGQFFAFSDSMRVAEGVFLSKITETQRLHFRKEADSLLQSGFPFYALNKKEKAPLFSLSDAYGKKIVLSELLVKGPVILYFTKGLKHPASSVTLKAAASYLPVFNKWGASVISISGDKPNKLKEWESRNKPGFTLAHDAGLQTATSFRLVYSISDSIAAAYESVFTWKNQFDYAPKLQNLTGVYLIAPNGKVAYASVSADPFRMASPRDLVRVLEGMGFIPNEK